MPECYNCGNQLPEGKLFRSTECPSCGRDAKVCLNCSFYKPGAHWDCAETISEPVRDKERANYCDFFAVAKGGGNKALNDGGLKSERAKKDFDNLFD